MSKTAKKVSFGPSIPPPQRALEDFVAAGGAAQEAIASAPPAPPAPPPASSAEDGKRSVVRLTIDVPEALHRRLRLYAAGDGRRLADIVRELLDANLPKV